MANNYQANSYNNNAYAQAQMYQQPYQQMYQQPYQAQPQNQGTIIPMSNPNGQSTGNGQMKQNPSPYKYATELVVIERSEVNLYANLYLSVPTEEDLKSGKFPGMDPYGKTRFDLYLFKHEEKKSLKYCIDVKTVKMLSKKTDALILKAVNAQKKTESDLPSTPAYTTRLKGSTFSGKTAAEILVADPNQRNSLLRQRDYYMQNVNNPRYGKNNREMVDAINDAVTLFDNGQLRKDIALSATTVLIDEIKTPDNSSVDKRGLTRTRQFKVTYSEGAESPYSVEIMNCMAPPTTALVGANLSQAQDMVRWNISLKETEWLHFITELMDTVTDIRGMSRKRRFDIYNTEPQYHK